MTGIDTNILLRYVLQDDLEQAKLANRAIELLSVENRGFVTTVVLCELNWSLRKAYKLAKPDCVAIIEHIMIAPEFEIEDKEQCWLALGAYRDGPADFADYLIREASLASGCDKVLTFDKAALKSPGFAEPK